MDDKKKEYNRKYWKSHYKTLSEMHRCARCGAVDERTKSGATRCQTCAELNKEYQKQLRLRKRGEKPDVKESLQHLAMSGRLTGGRVPINSNAGRPEGGANDVYLSYATQSKEVVNACLTCPYPDCKHSTVEKCKHYREVVYGKNNSKA